MADEFTDVTLSSATDSSKAKGLRYNVRESARSLSQTYISGRQGSQKRKLRLVTDLLQKGSWCQ